MAESAKNKTMQYLHIHQSFAGIICLLSVYVKLAGVLRKICICFELPRNIVYLILDVNWNSILREAFTSVKIFHIPCFTADCRNVKRAIHVKASDSFFD